MLLPALALTVSALATPATEARPQVLVLGTYHMANPKLDLVKVDIRDTMSAPRQAEIANLVDRLAAFRPTVVCVEETPETSDIVDRFRRYQAGEYTLTANETDQVAIRLAARGQNVRLVPIDYRNAFPMEPVFAAATPAQQQALGALTQDIGRRTVEVDAKFGVVEILAMMNDPAYLAWGHALYLGTIRLGDGDAGAKLMAAWSERNWRMTARTLAAIRSPEDRILVIVGASHAYPIATALRESMVVDVVSADAFLPKPPEPWVDASLQRLSKSVQGTFGGY